MFLIKSRVTTFYRGLFTTLICGLGSNAHAQIRPRLPNPPLEVSRPGSHPDAVRITFYSEAGLWGDSYTSLINPSTTKETAMAIPNFTFRAKSLLKRISSAKIVCGRRGAAFVFYDGTHNSNTSVSSWTGNTVVKHCSPRSTTSINFHQQFGTPQRVNFGDRISSALVVVHGAKMADFPFSTVLKNHWERDISQILGNDAKAIGSPELTFKGKRLFTIKQKIEVKIRAWPNYKGWFSYDVLLGATSGTGAHANMVKPKFRVTAHKVWVESGIIRGRVRRAVNTSVRRGYQKFNFSLNNGFGALPWRLSYYFSPGFDINEFFLYGSKKN